MRELTSYVKKNDTDTKNLNKLKELATKVTGIEEVEGETITDVIGFINDNYVGGSSGGSSEPIIYYGASYLLYTNEELNQQPTNEEAFEAFKKGMLICVDGKYYNPTYYYMDVRESLGSILRKAVIGIDTDEDMNRFCAVGVYD